MSIFRAISRNPMPEAQAVRISAQADFAMVRLTPKKDNEKLRDSKFDSPKDVARRAFRFASAMCEL